MTFKLGTLLQIGTAVLMLLFLPEESRTILFSTEAADWYGEVALTTPNGSIIIAKNASGKLVNLGLVTVDRNLWCQQGGTNAVPALNKTTVAAHTVAIVECPMGETGVNKRHVNFESGYVFAPRPLTLTTRADHYMFFVWMMVVIALFVTLSFLLAAYCGERSDWPSHKATELS